MEIIDAKVVERTEKHYICICLEGGNVEIPMSENKPVVVKSAFNDLILRIAEGNFQIELRDLGTDLFSAVAREYIKQLNSEIEEIFAEMEEKGLLYESEDEEEE